MIAAPAATIIECPEGYERSRSAGKESCIFREISGLALATRSLLMMDNGIRTSTAITITNAVFLPSHPPKIAINKITTGHITSLPYCVSKTMGLSSHSWRDLITSSNAFESFSCISCPKWNGEIFGDTSIDNTKNNPIKIQPAMKNFLIKQQGICSGFLYLDGQETGIYVGNT